MTLYQQSAMLMCLLLLPITGVTAADVVAGKTKAQICTGCHGPEGRGLPKGATLTPVSPKIAGMKERYLKKSIHEYRSNLRKEVFMNAVTAKLSDDEIDNLAAYFGSLSW